MSQEILVIGSIIVSILMVVIVNFIRFKNTKKPIHAAYRIMLPPLFMSTGALMYLIPMFRPEIGEILFAIVAGGLCSILLIVTSNFEIVDGLIYLRRSKLFLVVLIGLVTARMIGKIIAADVVEANAAQMSGMFFLLAFCMIVPWRIGMLVKYLRLKARL